MLTIAIAMIVVIGLVWFLGFKESSIPEPIEISKDIEIPNIDQPASTVNAHKPPKPTAENTKAIDEVLGANLSEQFIAVADAYELTARYPANSQVVQDAELVAVKEPFEESEVNLKFPDGKGGELPLSLAAATEKFQYFDGEKINARLIVYGAQENDSINVSAVVLSPSAGEISPRKTLDSSATSNTQFQAEFDSQVFPENRTSSEMLIRFSVDVNDQSLVATVPFKYGKASARLDSVPYSRAEAEYLLIALQFSVFDSGYYFVDAILDDAQTSRPLIQLQTEGRMKAGNDVMLLRAHQQALKDAGSQGPYSLRVRTVFRGAEPNEIADSPVSVPLSGFVLPAVNFAEYENTQYTDEEVQQRIEFLRGLGNKE